jgi:hypothetical protein
VLTYSMGAASAAAVTRLMAFLSHGFINPS